MNLSWNSKAEEKKKSTLFTTWKKSFYKTTEKGEPSAAVWSVWLTASKLDHKFSGWWQHLSAHPEGRDLNELHCNILGSFIPAEITQQQRNTPQTWKSNNPKGLGSSAVPGKKVMVQLKWNLSASAAGHTPCLTHGITLMECTPLGKKGYDGFKR